MRKSVKFPRETVPVSGAFDLIVCGAGLSGCAAAWNAARRGLDVLLLEHYHKLGGVPVSGILGIISGLRLDSEITVDGLFLREMIRRLEAVGGSQPRDGGWAYRVDPEKLDLVLFQMLQEAGAKILLQTTLIAARRERREISYIVTASKQGLEAWEAPFFIDDTGDADLAYFAGCPVRYGRDTDGKVQSSSLTFKLAGIDMTKAPRKMTEATALWQKQPHMTPTNHTVITYLPGTNGEAAVNMTHILDCAPLTHEGQARIRKEGMEQAMEIADFFRKNLPGFQNCYVAQTAMQPGIRETRRIAGAYTLTEEDVIKGRDFDDEIARGGWGIDIHVPDRIHGETPMPHFCLQKSYGIPFRCLLPQGVDNLLVAGRPISATHEAFSSSRINGTCIAVGEICGLAAVLAKGKWKTREIDVKSLQAEAIAQQDIVHRKTI